MGEKTSLHKVDVSEKETKFEKFTNDVKNSFERTQLQNWGIFLILLPFKRTSIVSLYKVIITNFKNEKLNHIGSIHFTAQ